MQEIISSVEAQSCKYGMALNADKTVAITMHVDKQYPLKLANGESVKYKTQHTYLGSEFSQTARQKPNINKRLAKANK